MILSKTHLIPLSEETLGELPTPPSHSLQLATAGSPARGGARSAHLFSPASSGGLSPPGVGGGGKGRGPRRGDSSYLPLQVLRGQRRDHRKDKVPKPGVGTPERSRPAPPLPN